MHTIMNMQNNKVLCVKPRQDDKHLYDSLCIIFN